MKEIIRFLPNDHNLQHLIFEMQLPVISLDHHFIRSDVAVGEFG